MSDQQLALSALDERELRLRERWHVRRCEVCRMERDGYQHALAQLAHALPVHEAPTVLRREVMQSISRNKPLRSWRARYATPVLVAACVVLLALAIMPSENMIDQVPVQSSGQMTMTEQGSQLRVTVSGLDEPGQGRTWQLWAIIDDTPTSLGLIDDDDDDDDASFDVPERAQAVAVTNEPSGGSAQPTSDIVASMPV